MPKPITVSEDTFQKTVLESPLPVLVDCWASWCAPCHIITPFLEQIAEEYDGRATVCKLNVDENQSLAQKFGIMSIPTILYFKNGEIQDQVIGALPKNELSSRLDNLL